jgi:hypothetical protein
MSNYYQDRITQAESIRSQIKHVNPEHISLSDIRDFLGFVIQDLEVLAALKRPDSYTLQRLPDLITRVTIQMDLDDDQAQDLVRKLWLELES